MYAYWFKSFWKSNWSRFDFVVVSIGLLTMTDLDLPGSQQHRLGGAPAGHNMFDAHRS